MLQELLNVVRSYGGVSSKTALSPIIGEFDLLNDSGFPNGDDTAVLATANGYDLFAIEGFIPEFVATDPWFAGWCGVMVNVSDISSMGGRARAVVNAIWNSNDDVAKQIFAGMKAASKVYGVPIVGGHTSHKSKSPQLAVSILGHANKLLSSFNAQEGEDILVAIDLRGEFRAPYLNWNATTHAPAMRLRDDYELLPMLAEAERLSSCKDISQAGLLGTLAMLMDCSNVGAQVSLADIPKPDTVKWQEWLCAFPSFGFVMTCPPENTAAVIESFRQRDIGAASIGSVTSAHKIEVINGNERAVFWDFDQASFLGFRQRNEIKGALCQ